MATVELTSTKLKAIGRNFVIHKFRYSPNYNRVEVKEVNESILFIVEFNYFSDRIANKLTIDALYAIVENSGAEVSNWFVTENKDEGRFELRFYLRAKKE